MNKTPFLYLSLLLAWTASYGQMQFKVIPGHADTKIQFTSQATMETVVGTTHTATGFVEFDPSSTGSGGKGEIHVDMASLKTGLDLRDRHMREDHLETKTYPEAVFTLATLTLPDGGLPEGKKTRVSVTGKFTLHGVDRTISPDTYMTLTNTSSGAAVDIESDFTVKLDDYKIPRPQFLMLRLAEEQKVHIMVHGVSVTKVASDSK